MPFWDFLKRKPKAKKNAVVPLTTAVAAPRVEKSKTKSAWGPTINEARTRSGSGSSDSGMARSSSGSIDSARTRTSSHSSDSSMPRSPSGSISSDAVVSIRTSRENSLSYSVSPASSNIVKPAVPRVANVESLFDIAFRNYHDPRLVSKTADGYALNHHENGGVDRVVRAIAKYLTAICNANKKADMSDETINIYDELNDIVKVLEKNIKGLNADDDKELEENIKAQNADDDLETLDLIKVLAILCRHKKESEITYDNVKVLLLKCFAVVFNSKIHDATFVKYFQTSEILKSKKAAVLKSLGTETEVTSADFKMWLKKLDGVYTNSQAQKNVSTMMNPAILFNTLNRPQHAHDRTESPRATRGAHR